MFLLDPDNYSKALEGRQISAWFPKLGSHFGCPSI